MIRREPAIHFQERGEVVLLLDLPGPLKLWLDAVFHAGPMEVLNVYVVRSLETTRGGGTLARKYRHDALANRALGLILRVQDRAESGEHCCIRAISFIADDEVHQHRRDEAGIPDFHDMLSRAELFQVAQSLRMLQRLVPILGGRQKYRNRLLRLDIHLDIAAIRERTISQPSVIVRGVQTHTLVIARQPIENSLLPKQRPSEPTNQQKRE